MAASALRSSSGATGAVARIDGDAHAEREKQLVPAYGDGLRDGGDDAAHRRGGLRGPGGSRQQRGERAAAKVRERVLSATGLLETPPELLKQLVGVFGSPATSRRSRSGRCA